MRLSPWRPSFLAPLAFAASLAAGCDPALVHDLPVPLPPNDDGRCPEEFTPTDFVVKPELDRVTCSFSPAGQGFRTVVERSRGGEGFLQIGEVDGESTTFDDTAATPDEDYQYRALAKSSSCESPPTAPVAVTTRGRAASALVLVETTTTSFRVAFQDENTRETGYVARAVPTEDAVPSVEVTLDALDGAAAEVLLEGLVADTPYDVIVASTGPFGEGTPATLPATTLALAPTDVNASVNGLTLDVSWVSDADDATAFVIDVVDPVSGASLQSVSTAADQRTATVALPADGTTLRVEVRAENAGGRSAPGTSDDITVPCLTGVGPSDVVVTSEPVDAATAALHVTFTSLAPSSYRFDVTATPAAGPAAQGSSTDGARVVDVSVPRDTTFELVLSHVGATGCTDGAPLTAAVTSVPFDVANLATESRAEGVELTWQDASSNETGVKVRRTHIADAVTVEVDLPPDTATHLDTDALRDETYTYEVIALGADGDAAPVVADVDTLPSEPVNLNVVNEGNALRLTWENTSRTATELRIDRAVFGSGAFATLTTLAPDATTFLDAPPDFAAYAYRVVVVNRGGSVFVEAAGSRACDASLAVNDFAFSVLDNDAVRLSFSPSSPDMAVTVQRTAPGGSFLDTGTSAAGATFFDDNSPARDAVFQYRAVGRAGVCTTPFTAVLEVHTAPNAVPAVNARRGDADPTVVELTWTDNNVHEAGYRVERQTPAGTGSFSPVGADLAPGTTSFVDTGALPGEQSAWRVVAVGRDAARASSEQNLRTAPLPPTLATVVGRVDRLALTWQPPARGVLSHFEILVDGNVVAFNVSSAITTQELTVFDDLDHEIVVHAVSGGIPSLASNSLTAHRHRAPVPVFAGGSVAAGVSCDAHLPGTVTFDGASTLAFADAASVPGFTVASAGADGVRGRVLLLDEAPSIELSWNVHDDLGLSATAQGRWRLTTDRQTLISSFRAFAGAVVVGEDLGAGRQPLTDVVVAGDCGGCVGSRASIAMVSEPFGVGRTIVLGADGRPWVVGDVDFQTAPTPRPLCSDGSLGEPDGTCRFGADLKNVVAVSANRELVCTLDKDGVSSCRGNGSFNETSVVQVVLGASHQCFLRNDGTVSCTGSDDQGQLGDGSGGFNGTVCADFCPGALTGVTHLASGNDHSCAANDQGLFCWGTNGQGQLGTGFGPNSDNAVQVSVQPGVKALAAGGDSTCAIDGSDGVLCFGGDFSSFPQRMSFGVTPIAVAVDRCVCVLGDQGDVECQSNNGAACEGRHFGGSSRICADDDCSASIDDAVAVATAGDSSCALSVSRGLLCWGDNTSGQLGDGTFSSRDNARPMCASGADLGCPPFELSSFRSCGAVSLDPLPALP